MLNNKLIKRLWQLFLVVLPALVLACVGYIKQGDVAFFEKVAKYIAPFVAWPIRFISNLMPFSVTELMAWFVPLALLIVVLLLVSRTLVWVLQSLLAIPRIFNNKYIAYWQEKTLFYWRYIGKLAFVLVCVASYVVSTYLLFHGYNYGRERISSKLNLPVEQVDETDLEMASIYVFQKLSEFSADFSEPADLAETKETELETSSTTQAETEIITSKSLPTISGEKTLPSADSSETTPKIPTESVTKPSQVHLTFGENAAVLADNMSELTLSDTGDVVQGAESPNQVMPVGAGLDETANEANSDKVVVDGSVIDRDSLDSATIDGANLDESEQAAPLVPAFTKVATNNPAPTSTTSITTKPETIKTETKASEIEAETTNESETKRETSSQTDDRSLVNLSTQLQVPSSNQALFNLALQAYQESARYYNFLDGQTLALKAVTMSYYWSFTHTTGMYMPLFMEANVNVSQLPPYILFTAAHELAHQRFFAREDEANFLAFFTLSKSQDRYANYSAYLNAWTYLSKDLFKVNHNLAIELYRALPAVCRRDIELEDAYWQQFKTQVARDSQQLNNEFIKANGDERGVVAYDEVSKLIVAHFKATGQLDEVKQTKLAKSAKGLN